MKLQDEWGNVFNQCVVEFTGRNGHISSAVPQLNDVAIKSGPLAGALTALDETLPDGSTPGSTKDFDKKYKIWVVQEKKLISVANGYGVILKAALEALKPRENEFPAAYRAVKALGKQMNVVVFRVQKLTSGWSSEVLKANKKADESVAKATEKLRQADVSNDDIKTETNWLKQQRMLVAFPTSFTAGHAKAEAIVQKIKLKPTKDVYDKEMAGARDLTQNMSNVIKLLDDKNCPDSLKQSVTGITAHKAQLDAFGSGAKRTIAATKTKDQILDQLKEFSNLIKAMKPFGDNLTKYLAKSK